MRVQDGETGESVPFDHEQALAAVGDDAELLGELAEIFLSNLPQLVDEIEQSIREGNSEGLQHAAHTLKGAVSTFRAETTVAAAFCLEQMGRGNDLGDASTAYERLRDELSHLTPELEKLVSS